MKGDLDITYGHCTDVYRHRPAQTQACPTAATLATSHRLPTTRVAVLCALRKYTNNKQCGVT